MKKIALTGTGLSEKCKITLSRLGYYIIELPPYSALPSLVNTHCDMLIFLCRDMLLCCANYYKNTAKAAIDRILDLRPQLRLELTDEQVGDAYPDDILLNAMYTGGYIFGLIGHISKRIVYFANKNNIPAVNVRQGYAKCSSCIVSDGALITSDASIAKAARDNSLDVLSIRPGYISLEGADYGFIGGASGYDDSGVYFCGDITTHPDYVIIRDFCLKHGKSVVSLSDEPLSDTGSIFFI